MSDIALIALLFILDAFLFIGLGIPLLQGQVPPNSWYGFRTRKTLSDEKTWYAVNRVTGRDMILAGVAIIISSLLLLIFGSKIGFGKAAAILIGITLLSVTWMIIHGYKILKRM
jgi:uncharacterized membrane protein